MDRNIRMARDLIRMARILVSNDEKVLEKAIKDGHHLPDDMKEEALDIVEEVVNESGNEDAKALLEQMEKGNRSAKVAVDWIEKIKQVCRGNKKLMFALLAAASIFDAMPSAMAQQAVDLDNANSMKKTTIVHQNKIDKQKASDIANDVAKRLSQNDGMSAMSQIDDVNGAKYVTGASRIMQRMNPVRAEEFASRNCYNEAKRAVKGALKPIGYAIVGDVKAITYIVQ